MKGYSLSTFAFSFTLLLAFSACSSTNSTKSSGSSSESNYKQVVDPFLVYTKDGELIAFPFLGGFNTPRPQFVDIDNDGDTDLFLQEQSEELMFFEYVEEKEEFPLEWKTNELQNLNIGEWFRFVDIDQDGDFDLLAEQPFSYIRVYRNEGNAISPEFVAVVDTLKDINGTPIFSDRQNIPNVTDIDCDENLDLFIGSLDGTLSRYESQGLDENGLPRFELITKRFQDIEIVKQFGTLHGANSMTFIDMDSDGDQDIFWGDFFEPSILLLENIGSCNRPNFVGEPQPFPSNNPVLTSGYNVPSLADWGSDGDMDLFLGVLGGAYNTNETTAENFYFLEQKDGDFSLSDKQFLNMIDVGDESIVSTGDLDGDGDLDMLLANKIDPEDLGTSVVYRFENTGSQTKPEFKMNGTLDLPKAYHYAPVLADFNNDGLDDMLLGNWKGNIDYYINTGPGFRLQKKDIANLNRGSNAVPALADLDGDGDLDMIAGQSGGGLDFFRNTASENELNFEYEPDILSGIKAKHRSAPAFYDIDNDGDYDLILGSKIEGFLFFRNEGSKTNPAFVKEDFPFKVIFTQLGTPHFTDLDGDGIAEFISGTRGGGVLFYDLD